MSSRETAPTKNNDPDSDSRQQRVSDLRIRVNNTPRDSHSTTPQAPLPSSRTPSKTTGTIDSRPFHLEPPLTKEENLPRYMRHTQSSAAACNATTNSSSTNVTPSKSTNREKNFSATQIMDEKPHMRGTASSKNRTNSMMKQPSGRDDKSRR